MLPRPTAEPAAARIKPTLPENEPLSDMVKKLVRQNIN
jgi:hypothetical protein